jgi:hypothetical protein
MNQPLFTVLNLSFVDQHTFQTVKTEASQLTLMFQQAQDQHMQVLIKE